MRISGIGVDIVNVKRFSILLDTYSDRFLKRIFTENEISELKDRALRHESVAGLFAAKEAVIKALGLPFRMQSVEILHKNNSSPYVSSHSNVMVSISHDGEYALAFAVAYDTEV